MAWRPSLPPKNENFIITSKNLKKKLKLNLSRCALPHTKTWALSSKCLLIPCYRGATNQ